MLVPRCCFPERRFRSLRLLTAAGAVLATLPFAASLSAQSSGNASAVSSPVALAGASRWIDSVRTLADRAYILGDTAGFTTAFRLAQRSLTAFPDDALLLHLQGYIRYRQAQRLRDFESALPVYEEAVSLLERSAAVRPLPETYALLASATGSMIGDSMMRGIRYGMRASRAEERAEELGPDNPRVLLLRAVSAWYKPSAFGGGEDKARALLQRALRQFASDAPARPLPQWGHAEAYAWLGQMEMKAGNRAGARAAYDKALTLAPGFAWVQYVLRPAVERP